MVDVIDKAQLFCINRLELVASVCVEMIEERTLALTPHTTQSMFKES